MRSRILIAATLVVLPAVAFAQQVTATPQTLFKSLEGKWGCSGGFPDGRALQADLEFAMANGGRTLRFTHADRAPGAYWQDATWLFDAKPGRVMSLSTSGSTKNASVSPALFLGAQWTDSSIVLEADTLKSPPWTPNRFSYALRGGASLLMRWEVQRNGAWSLGDSLVCARSPK